MFSANRVAFGSFLFFLVNALNGASVRGAQIAIKAAPTVLLNPVIATECKVSLEKVANDQYKWLPALLRNGPLMVALLDEPEMRSAIDYFLSQKFDMAGPAYLTTQFLEPYDRYRALLERLNSFERLKVKKAVANYIAERIQEIVDEYVFYTEEPAPTDQWNSVALGIVSARVFKTDARPNRFRINLAKVAGNYLLFPLKQMLPPRSDDLAQALNLPFAIDLANLGTTTYSIRWMPGVLKNSEFMISLISYSASFRQLVSNFVNAASGRKLNDSFDASDVYVELIRTLQNDGKDRRDQAAKVLGDFLEPLKAEANRLEPRSIGLEADHRLRRSDTKSFLLKSIQEDRGTSETLKVPTSKASTTTASSPIEVKLYRVEIPNFQNLSFNQLGNYWLRGDPLIKNGESWGTRYSAFLRDLQLSLDAFENHFRGVYTSARNGGFNYQWGVISQANLDKRFTERELSLNFIRSFAKLVGKTKREWLIPEATTEERKHFALIVETRILPIINIIDKWFNLRLHRLGFEEGSRWYYQLHGRFAEIVRGTGFNFIVIEKAPEPVIQWAYR